MKHFFALLLFLTINLQSQEITTSLVSTEGLTDILVGGHVCPISGDFVHSALDKTIAGPDPLSLQRTYCSSRTGSGHIKNSWLLQEPVRLGTTADFKDKGGYARVSTSKGAYVRYDCKEKKDANKVLKYTFGANKGYTNCGTGFLSAKTNLKNNQLSFNLSDKKHKYSATLKGQDGSERFFYYRHDFEGFRNFELEYEKKSNRTQKQYSYDKKTRVKFIKSLNDKADLVYAQFDFDYLSEQVLIIKSNDGEDIYYKFFPYQYQRVVNNAYTNNQPQVATGLEFYLFEVINPKKPIQKYEYNFRSAFDARILSKIILPDDRYLAVNYYKIGDIAFNNEKIKIKDDSPILDRVNYLASPVGTDSSPIITYQFKYNYTYSHDKQLKKGFTEVYDALGHKTEYRYNDDHRITSVISFKKKSMDHSTNYSWGPNGSCDEGNLAGIYIKNHDDKVISGKFYYYDVKGNLERVAEYGIITGTNNTPIQLGLDGKPQNFEAAEHYDRTFTYDERNNIFSEWEQNGKNVKYTYFENTNAPSSKILRDHSKIIAREFYEYDDNLFLLKKISDDGVTYNKDDLSGITVRQITYYKPRNKFPFGLHEEIRETYYDSISGKELLLKRMVNEHTISGKLSRQTIYDANDEYAYTLSWEYDAHDNCIKETNALGESIIRKYDANDNLIYEAGPSLDVSKDFFYDYSNRLIKIVERHPDGEFVTQHRYDYCNNRIATVDRHGKETLFFYDDFNRLFKVQHPHIEIAPDTFIVPVEKFKHNILGFVYASTDKQGYTTTYKLNCQGKSLSTIFPDGSEERNEYRSNGDLVKCVQKNGSSIVYKRDSLGRVIKESYIDSNGSLLSSKAYSYKGYELIQEVDAEGNLTQYTYDGAGRLKLKIVGDQKTEYQYDSLSRKQKEIRWIDHKQANVTNFEYDLLNRLISQKIMDIDGHVFFETQSKYDVCGNLIFEKEGDEITQTEYNTHNHPTKIVDAERNVTRFQYDYRSHQSDEITRIDPLGNQIILQKDESGKILSKTHKNSFGLLTAQTLNYYAASGDLSYSVSKCIDEGSLLRNFETAYVYRWDHQLVELIECPGLPEQKIKKYSYNSFGQKNEYRKPDGNILKYEYDDKGLLVRLSSSDNSIDYRYSYNKNDLVIEVGDFVQNTTTKRSYDVLNRVVFEKQATGLTIKYRYDSIGRQSQIILPDSSIIEYIYDSNYLREIKRSDYSQQYSKYNHNNLPLEIILPNKQGKLEFSYDKLQRLTQIKHAERSQQNIYDSIGNITSQNIKDWRDSLNLTFKYDALYQLVSESGLEDHTYRYDSLNNCLKKDQLINQHNNLNELVAQNDVIIEYDLNGNRIKKIEGAETTIYSYDALDRLVKVAKEEQEIVYTYDSFNRRMTKGAKSFLYDGQNELAIYSNDKVFCLRVPDLANEAIAFEYENKTLIPLHDQIGNVVHLLSNDQSKIYRYSVFGQEIDPDPQDDHPYRFAGKHFDKESGFIYFGHRFYDPQISRFITPDPIGFADGPNLYAYVHNNPITHLDLLGLSDNERTWTEKIYDKGIEAFNYGLSILQKPRVKGGIQFVSGCAEAASGALVILETGGTGSVIGWPIMTHGLDQAFTGFQSSLLGISYDTVTSQLIQKAGLSQSTSNNMDAVLSMTNVWMGTYRIAQNSFSAYPRIPPINVPKIQTMNPQLIRFSHDKIKNSFRDGKTIEDLVNGLKNGTIKPSQIPPIRLCNKDGLLYTIDNRRLAAFQQADVPIPYRMATLQEQAEALTYKFTTNNEGVSVIIKNSSK